MTSQSKTHITIFDLDDTLLKGNCGALFFLYLIKQKIIPKRSIFHMPYYHIKYRYFRLSLRQLHKLIFNRMLRGASFESFKELIGAFVQEKIIPVLNLSTISLLKRAQHLGHHTVILSNSPSFLVEPIAQLLGVDEYRATEYSVDEKGCFHRILSILDGKQKAQFVQKLRMRFSLRKNATTAYSDSHHDIPLLQAVANPVAVNPDKKLLDVSKKMQWKVI